jgi:hypothetical protein
MNLDECIDPELGGTARISTRVSIPSSAALLERDAMKSKVSASMKQDVPRRLIA